MVELCWVRYKCKVLRRWQLGHLLAVPELQQRCELWGEASKEDRQCFSPPASVTCIAHILRFYWIFLSYVLLKLVS